MPTAFKDYYATLGVPRTATEKEIHGAFRKLARKHHPDVNRDDPGAEQRFKEVNEAHEVLGDPEKRRKYDELGPRWQEYEAWERAGKPGQNPFAGFGGAQPGGAQFEYRNVSPDELEELFGERAQFSDFFQTFFGGAERGGFGRRSRGRVRSQRGEDVQGEAEITLEEAFRGTARTVELGSSGARRRVEVRIPPGIADGARVRAAGQGGHGSGDAASGDLYVRVHVLPDPRFHREGANLTTRVAVPLHIALAGGAVPVTTLGGRAVELTVPPGTQNGSRLRLRGLGMPQVRGGGAGDLIAEVDVRLPAPVPEELRAWAAQPPLREE
jgi:curved DNA-binding protein